MHTTMLFKGLSLTLSKKRERLGFGTIKGLPKAYLVSGSWNFILPTRETELFCLILNKKDQHVDETHLSK